MDKAVDFFHEQVRFLRLGTVTTQLVETIKVACYGNQMPIKHIATCQKVQSGISVEPHDPNLVGPTCTALKAAGFNAYQFSKTTVLVSVPPPSGEERERVHKRVRELGEEAKIAVRQVRQKYKKKLEKDDLDDLQKATDEAVGLIEEIVRDKIAAI